MRPSATETAPDTPALVNGQGDWEPGIKGIKSSGIPMPGPTEDHPMTDFIGRLHLPNEDARGPLVVEITEDTLSVRVPMKVEIEKLGYIPTEQRVSFTPGGHDEYGELLWDFVIAPELPPAA